MEPYVSLYVFCKKEALMYHLLICFMLKWSKTCKHRRAGAVYVLQNLCSLVIKTSRVAKWVSPCPSFVVVLPRPAGSPTCFIVIIYMHRHWFDVWDRQALLHTEGEADFLLGDLEMARQEDASELFKTIPEVKIEQILFWVRLCDNVLFYSSLQLVNLMLNQTIV